MLAKSTAATITARRVAVAAAHHDAAGEQLPEISRASNAASARRLAPSHTSPRYRCCRGLCRDGPMPEDLYERSRVIASAFIAPLSARRATNFMMMPACRFRREELACCGLKEY